MHYSEIDNEKWKHRRALFNPGFHRQILMTFVEQFNSKADILMERLRSMADGKTQILLFKEINHATLDAIALVSSVLKTIFLVLKVLKNINKNQWYQS